MESIRFSSVFMASCLWGLTFVISAGCFLAQDVRFCRLLCATIATTTSLCIYLLTSRGFSDLDVNVDLVVEVDVDVDGAESPLLTLVDSWLYLSSLG